MHSRDLHRYTIDGVGRVSTSANVAMEAACPTCGEEFTYVGLHWNRGSCGYPEIPESVEERLIGILMGDGNVESRDGKNGYMRITSVTNEFLEWIKQTCPWLFTEVRVTKTPEQSREYVEDYVEDASDYTFRTIYELKTRSHPYFKHLREKWYPNNEKYFPDALDLTPEMVRMWYAADGYIASGSESLPPTIRADNEMRRPEYLRELFNEHGFDPSVGGGDIRFNGEDRDRFLKWIGDPVPGFEYKWERQSREHYDAKRAEVI